MKEREYGENSYHYRFHILILAQNIIDKYDIKVMPLQIIYQRNI